VAKKVNVSYESLRQEGRKEVLEWLLEHGIVNYSRVEKKYFVVDDGNDWLLMLPWIDIDSKT
jgi:hypothetical protein